MMIKLLPVQCPLLGTLRVKSLFDKNNSTILSARVKIIVETTVCFNAQTGMVSHGKGLSFNFSTDIVFDQI